MLSVHTGTAFTFDGSYRRQDVSVQAVDTVKSASHTIPRDSSISDTSRQSLFSVIEALFPMGIESFADTVVLYDPGALGKGTGDEPDTSFQSPRRALGPPDYALLKDSAFVSLGIGGTLVLKFVDNGLIDGPGPDLRLFEINTDPEDVWVWISEDGDSFLPVGRASVDSPYIDIRPYVRPGLIFRYVKLRDDVNQGGTGGIRVGADIDAIGAINTVLYFELPSDRFFDRGSFSMRPGAAGKLLNIADRIRSLPNPRVLIKVHTDNRGSSDYNQYVSKEQAVSVRNALLDVHQIRGVDILALGLGESDPVASNDTDEGCRINRRIEILIR